MLHPSPEQSRGTPTEGSDAISGDIRKQFETFKRKNPQLKNPVGTFTLKVALGIKRIHGAASYKFYKTLPEETREELDLIMTKVEEALGLSEIEKETTKTGEKAVRQALGKIQKLAAAGEPVAAVEPAVARTPAENPQFSMREIAFFGDSITDGLDPHLKALGAARVEGYGGRGVVGTVERNTLRKGFQNFLAAKKRGEYPHITTVFILAGVNDIANNKTVATIQENLLEMYGAAHDAGLKVIASTLTPWEKHMKNHRSLSAKVLQRRTKELNDWIRSQKSGTVDNVVDLETEIRTDGSNWVGQLHPYKGYSVIAEKIRKAVS